MADNGAFLLRGGLDLWYHNGVDHSNEVTPRRARLVPRWVTAGIPSSYLTRHSGQLGLLPSVGREMSSSEEAQCSAVGNVMGSMA